MLVIQYDTEGDIRDWRYEIDDEYQAADDEIVVNPSSVDHRRIDAYRVDTSSDPAKLVKKSNPQTPESVQREEISQESKDEFRAARSNNDLQTQLDILFEILTGEQP